jgi:hypothetical protein
MLACANIWGMNEPKPPLGRPKGTVKFPRRLMVRCTDDDLRRLGALARKAGKRIGQYVRDLIRREAKREGVE